MEKKPMETPIISKLYKLTLFIYSGSKNKYGIPMILPHDWVTNKNSKTQSRSNIWFLRKLFSNNCTGNEYNTEKNAFFITFTLGSIKIRSDIRIIILICFITFLSTN